MSISARNLWPEDIAVTDVVAPVSIMKEQASLLGERTKNLVEGRVTPGADSAAKVDLLLENRFRYDFDLVAPALNNYRYRLFSILHGLNFYPLTLESAPLDSGPIQVTNEEQFLTWLEAIFSAEKTKTIISLLIAQSRA